MAKGKRVYLEAPKKAKRPSNMTLTISEGNEYVKQAERVLPRIAKRKAE